MTNELTLSQYEATSGRRSDSAETTSEHVSLVRRANAEWSRLRREYEVIVPNDESSLHRERDAIFDVAEMIRYYDEVRNGENGPATSASIGSVSVNYGGSAGDSIDLSDRGLKQAIYNIARRYFEIYRGVE